MFGNITATSAAQYQALSALIAEAVAEGNTVDGLLTDNPTRGVARFVLVIDDAPATGTEYDRVYDFDGEEIARAGASVGFKIAQIAEAVEDELGTPGLDLVA